MSNTDTTPALSLEELERMVAAAKEARANEVSNMTREVAEFLIENTASKVAKSGRTFWSQGQIPLEHNGITYTVSVSVLAPKPPVRVQRPVSLVKPDAPEAPDASEGEATEDE